MTYVGVVASRILGVRYWRIVCAQCGETSRRYPSNTEAAGRARAHRCTITRKPPRALSAAQRAQEMS